MVFTTSGPRSPCWEAELKFCTLGGTGGTRGCVRNWFGDSSDIITTYTIGTRNSSPIKIAVVNRHTRLQLRTCLLDKELMPGAYVRGTGALRPRGRRCT